jgi:hypothetical protein
MKFQDIEVELVPSASMLKRSDIPSSLKKHRFIKSHRNTTSECFWCQKNFLLTNISVEHLSEYLLQICRTEVIEFETKNQSSLTSVPTPTFFFAFVSLSYSTSSLFYTGHRYEIVHSSSNRNSSSSTR